MKERIWDCKIGGAVVELPPGADLPMREAVAEAFLKLTGIEADFIFSGWGGSLNKRERAVVENRKPGSQPMSEFVQELRTFGLPVIADRVAELELDHAAAVARIAAERSDREELVSRIAELERQNAELRQQLLDPATVHASMLAGQIAKISIEQCAHTHGAEALAKYQQLAASADKTVEATGMSMLMNSERSSHTIGKCIEVLRAERDHARAMYDSATSILLGIHALLYPPTVKAEDGNTYAFRSPMLHEQMQALSDRIRAIPDEIAALAQAGKEQGK